MSTPSSRFAVTGGFLLIGAFLSVIVAIIHFIFEWSDGAWWGAALTVIVCLAVIGLAIDFVRDFVD